MTKIVHSILIIWKTWWTHLNTAYKYFLSKYIISLEICSQTILGLPFTVIRALTRNLKTGVPEPSLPYKIIASFKNRSPSTKSESSVWLFKRYYPVDDRAIFLSVCLSAHLNLRLMGELIVYQLLPRPASVRPQFQTSSPLKPLGQLRSHFVWRLLRTRERKFVQTVLVTLPRWSPRPYVLKAL